MAILGNYAVTWSDTDHNGTERQHSLRLPPQRIKPAVRGNIHRAVSLDFSAQETVVLGTAHEASFMVRADKNPRSLADLAEAGIKGATLNIYDLDQPDRTIAVYLVDPYDVWLAVFDPLSAYREWQADFRVRRTDGSAFPDWFLYGARGTDGLLFKYEPGMDLSGATFARASTATYLNVAGVTTTAATNVARDGHYQLVSSVFTRTLRLESSTSESLYLPFAHPPQALSFYVKWIEQTATPADAILLAGDNATGSFQIYGISGAYRAAYYAAGGTKFSNPGVSCTTGDVCEFVGAMSSAGVVTATINKNGTETSGAASAGVALDSAFPEERIYLNGEGAVTGTADFVSVKVAAGVQTMDKMRSL